MSRRKLSLLLLLLVADVIAVEGRGPRPSSIVPPDAAEAAYQVRRYEWFHD
ncbi:hypothetical protein [Methylobacterium sp. A54F]